jgi:hypothetical protein
MPSLIVRVQTVEDKWRHIKSFPWIGECPADAGRHAWIYQAAKGCAASVAGIKPEHAEELIRRDLTRPEKHPGEIRHQVANAYKRDYSGGGAATPRADYGSYNPDLLAHVASHVPFEITDDWLAEAGPECVLDVSPSRYLDALFKSGEFVAVKRSEADLGFIYQVGDTDAAQQLNAYVKRSKVGAWYYANPITGIRRDSAACYGDAQTSEYRHLMVESDLAPRELWLAMMVQLHTPILAMYESGGRSVHAIIRVNASTKAEFDAIVSSYKRQLVPLGMCTGSGKATQATRLPGVYRADKGRWQKLLYLAPNATSEPIYQEETRRDATNTTTGKL